MSDDVKDAVRGVMSAFEEFKATHAAQLAEIKTKGVADPLFEAKLRKIDEVLDKDEARNQAITAVQTQSANAVREAAELKTQLEALQLKMGRPGAGGGRDAVETKARVNDWIRGVCGARNLGMANLPEEQKLVLEGVMEEYKSLGISNDADGGFLAPSEFVAEILKKVTEISPVRALARIRTTANRSVHIPTRTGQFTASRTAERDNRPETTGLQYGSIEIQAPEMYAMIGISNAMLEDAAFDMAAELNMEATEQFAKLEGLEFVSGSGVNSMEGILVNGTVSQVVTGTAATIADANGTADGLINAYANIKTAYTKNASWVLNRRTIGAIRRLKDGQNRYIWVPGIADKQPNTIDSAPYVECPDMPDIAANTFPVAFGDFFSAYTVVDRVAMTMLRDPFSSAAGGLVNYWFRRRSGGQLVMPEAITKVKCST